jgi:hypothetical protein
MNENKIFSLFLIREYTSKNILHINNLIERDIFNILQKMLLKSNNDKLLVRFSIYNHFSAKFIGYLQTFPTFVILKKLRFC